MPATKLTDWRNSPDVLAIIAPEFKAVDDMPDWIVKLCEAVAASGSPPSPPMQKQLDAIREVIGLIDRVEEMRPADREIYNAGCEALNALEVGASSGSTGAPTDPRFPFGVADWKSDHAAMCAWLEFGNVVHNQTHGDLHAQIVDRMEKLCAAIWKVRAVAGANSVFWGSTGAPDEKEWEAAFATPAFAKMVTEARADIAAGRTEPMDEESPAGSTGGAPTREQVEALLWKDNGTSFATPIHNGAINAVLALYQVIGAASRVPSATTTCPRCQQSGTTDDLMGHTCRVPSESHPTAAEEVGQTRQSTLGPSNIEAVRAALTKLLMELHCLTYSIVMTDFVIAFRDREYPALSSESPDTEQNDAKA